jgi:hypothetical protein
MARKINARTVVNRKALNAISSGFVAGMEAMGKAIIDRTTPPDAEPFGEGLVTTGDYGVWAGTKKVAGTATKPRAVRLSKTGITLLAGYGFPGRFQELGTIHQPARPFFTPSVLGELPDTHDHLKGPVRKALASVP